MTKMEDSVTRDDRKDRVNLGGYDWLVLDAQNGKALLLSDKSVEKRAYHNKKTYQNEHINITWEECDLRKYLNGEFYNKLGPEKTMIAETKLINNNNPWHGTAGGSATTDKIFLLSIEEVIKYFGDSGQLKNRPAPDSYCIDDQYNSARIAAAEDDTASWWWLRSPGLYANNAVRVDDNGRVVFTGRDVRRGGGGVRPALWIDSGSSPE